MKKQKLNQQIDYLQELKRDVSTKGSLTPFQKICFEHIEKELGQPNSTIEEVKPEDVPFKKYKKLEMENEVLKDVIIKLTVKIMALEKELHPDVW